MTGGIDLAAEWAGFETVGQCEFAEYQTKVLEKHWPEVERWKDVRDITIKSIGERGIENITLLSGGFPCQPHSLAGKRRASNDERDLWGEFARIICEFRPKWVLGENVPGLLSSEDGRFFGRILRDLARMGYRVGWGCYGANTVGAVHQRKGCFSLPTPVASDTWTSNLKSTQHKEGSRHSLNLPEVLMTPSLHRQRVCGGGSENEIQRGQELQRFIHPRSITEWRRRCEIYQPKLCGTYNGIPGQVDRLKCLGNAVVPQQVYPILQAIADIERSMYETRTNSIPTKA